MRIYLKITRTLFNEVWADLDRPHAFAAERVGFLACRPGHLSPGLILLAHQYHPVNDSDYVDDPTVGARIGSGAFRKPLQFTYNNPASIWHVHGHNHTGKPGFSLVDTQESSRFMPGFWNARPEMPHGTLVLSRDSATGSCWYPGMPHPLPVTNIIIVGMPAIEVRSPL